MPEFRLKIRDDADSYYRAHRGKVMPDPFESFDDANEIRRAMVNGAEFEVIEIGKDTE